MSETKKIKVPSIPEDAVITLKISGAFQRRLIGAYFNYAKKFEPQKFEQLCKAVAVSEIGKLEDGQDQIDAFTIETLLILMNGIETEFRNKGLLTQVDMDVPIED